MRRVEELKKNRSESLQDYLDDKIETQIEERKHIDQQAGKLLSIWLTFIGIFITIGIAVSSGRVSAPLQPLNADTISNELGFLVAILGNGWDKVVFTTVFFTGGLAAVAMIIYLFIWAPYQALSVLKAEYPEHWISVTDNQLMDRDGISTSTIESWQKVQINRNQDRVREAKKHGRVV